MALFACLQKTGIKKHDQKKALRSNLSVYSDYTVRDFFHRTRVFIIYLILRIVLEAEFGFCMFRRIASLLPDWISSLFRFCPPLESLRPNRPLVIGHRGNPLKYAENTVEACTWALDRLRAEALEVDICLTADEQVVLWHDWDPLNIQSIVRQMGLEPKVKFRPYVPDDHRYLKSVNRLSLDEFRRHYGYSHKWGRYRKTNARIPTLEEFYLWAVEQSTLKALFLDVKIPLKEKHTAVVLIKYLLRLIKENPPRFEIILLTPEEQVLHVMRNIYNGFPYVLDVVLPLILVLDPAEFSAVERARKLGTRYASIGRPTALDVAPWSSFSQIILHDRKQMQALGGLPEQLFVWTINKRSEMKCLIKLGVNGIMTDKPKTLRKIVT